MARRRSSLSQLFDRRPLRDQRKNRSTFSFFASRAFRPAQVPSTRGRREGRKSWVNHEHVVADTDKLDGFRTAPAADAARARPAARRRLPAPLDVDPDQLVRRAGDDARATADGGAAAARQPDADGPADGDGTAAVRAVLA